MAGSLVQVATNTVTSAVASVSLTGIDSDDVYMVAYTNVSPSTDHTYLYARTTTSGTADSDSEYDYAHKWLETTGTFSNFSSVNQDKYSIENAHNGTVTGETAQGICYLYNFNNSSEYSFFVSETSSGYGNATTFYGAMGGCVHTVAEANDGISFTYSSGNIASGTFTLYKVV